MTRSVVLLTAAAVMQACQPAPAVREVESTPREVSVAQLLTDEIPVGARVEVRGTCIGYSRVVALGPPPRTRSDWQLEADGVAVWVVGSYPPGCSGTEPAREARTLSFEVAADTLPALGTQTGRVRRYLLYTVEEGN